jgi:hypothetical protein
MAPRDPRLMRARAARANAQSAAAVAAAAAAAAKASQGKGGGIGPSRLFSVHLPGIGVREHAVPVLERAALRTPVGDALRRKAVLKAALEERPLLSKPHLEVMGAPPACARRDDEATTRKDVFDR